MKYIFFLFSFCAALPVYAMNKPAQSICAKDCYCISCLEELNLQMVYINAKFARLAALKGTLDIHRENKDCFIDSQKERQMKLARQISEKFFYLNIYVEKFIEKPHNDASSDTTYKDNLKMNKADKNKKKKESKETNPAYNAEYFNQSELLLNPNKPSSVYVPQNVISFVLKNPNPFGTTR
jgi:hypothetical protein